MAVTIDGSGEITGLDEINNIALPTTGFGKVLQVVRATDSTLRQTTSSTYVDVTGMSITITPQVSTSAIIVIATAFGGSSAAADSRYNLRITDASNNALSGAQAMQLGNAFSGQSQTNINIWGYVTPATTSAVTYKLQFSSNGGTVSIQNNSTTGQMYAIEVSA